MNEKNDAGETALMAAALINSADTARMLIEAGADGIKILDDLEE